MDTLDLTADIQPITEFRANTSEILFLKGLVAGLRDINSGQVVDGEEFFKSLKIKLNDGQ